MFNDKHIINSNGKNQKWNNLKIIMKKMINTSALIMVNPIFRYETKPREPIMEKATISIPPNPRRKLL
jgi:hypothetical protein